MKNKNHIEGLGIPEGYFDSLEADILNRIETEEAESWLLANYGITHGLSVPSEYWTILEQKVKNFCSDSRSSSPVINIRRYLGYASAIAACLIVGIFIVSNWGSTRIISDDTKSFDALLAETVISDEHLEIFSYEELNEFVNENEESVEFESETLEFLLDDDTMLDEFSEEYFEL